MNAALATTSVPNPTEVLRRRNERLAKEDMRGRVRRMGIGSSYRPKRK